ncbi:nucleolar protein 58-like [Miscanthus floridulus]|uniref:nucleolar protein 58-like n=1 Tax=Miscanthus floridulus TaxID=154761 RepID=UPI003459EB1C
MYMHITPRDGSSSTKKKDKDLAFKASQEKGKARIEYESLSDDEVDDASLALTVRKNAKMLKKLNKNDIKFDSKKKKFFTSTRRKPIFEMDCYNCGELGHLAYQCTKPKKDKYKKNYKDKKDDSSDEDEDKKNKNKPYKKKDGKKKDFHKKKKNGKAYIVSEWLTDIDLSSCSSDDDSDNEKVAVIMIDSSLSSPIPPPSSSTLLYLMAKSERKALKPGAITDPSKYIVQYSWMTSEVGS